MQRFFAILLFLGMASMALAQSAAPADATSSSKEKESAEKNAPAHSKEVAKKLTVAHIELRGHYSEGPGAPGLFSEVVETLNDALLRLKKAANDEHLEAVVLHISGPHIGWAKLNELRTAIGKIRQKGRKVFAWLESADTKDYLIATACDQIVIPESGMVMIPGLRAEISFYKELFDMLSIQPEVLRVGEFKSAAEPYSRSEMSPAFREEMEAIIDDYYRQIVETIAESRKLTQDQVKSLIDTGLFSATDAKKSGLIDHVAYEDHIQTLIKGDRKEAEVKITRGYGKKKIDTDFSGFGGVTKMMNLLMGAEPNNSKSSKPKIAVIGAVGPIVTGVSQSDFFGEESMGSTTIIKAIRQARDDASVKAIVLRVDSPGGSALASDLMWHELETLEGKKPFVVSMGDTAASGGYYISMGADRIFAEPGTLTGSIGVVGGKLALEKFYKKIGITMSVVQKGKNAGVLSVSKPWTDAEREAMQKMMNDIYDQFTKKAATGRKMEHEKLEKMARGRVYTGAQALKLGLVDELGTLDEAIAYAKKSAGFDPESKVERLDLPRPISPFEALFGPTDPSTRLVNDVTKTWVNRLPPELATQIRGLELYELLAQERVLTVLPYRLFVK
jgi:protease IV